MALETNPHKLAAAQEQVKAWNLTRIQKDQLMRVLWYIQENWLERTAKKYYWPDFLLKILESLKDVEILEKRAEGFDSETSAIIQELSWKKDLSETEKRLLEYAKKTRDFRTFQRKIHKILWDINHAYSRLTLKIDPKTKQHSKYWFDRALQKQFERLMEWLNKNMSIMIFDQNGLKDINETYWHDFWQSSILEIWKILEEEFWKQWEEKRKKLPIGSYFEHKDNYFISNYYWWDEWFVILIDVDFEKTKKIVQNIFKRLKNHRFKVPWKKKQQNQEIELSTCCWISYLKGTPQTRFNPKLLLRLADHLLLSAKSSRGNSKIWKKLKAEIFDPATIEHKLKNQLNRKPRNLKESETRKMTLSELENLRRIWLWKLADARTILEKKITNENIELINIVMREKLTK